MRCLRTAILRIVVPAMLSVASATSFAAPQAGSADALENPLEPLAPRQVRTEEEDDRLSALAHFAAAHILNQRDQRFEALRQYERSLRLTPGALPALREMAPLADSLGRTDEAMRYLVKYAQQHPDDPLLLERSAEYLAETGESQKALGLYRQLVQLLAKEPPSSRRVAAQQELGNLCVLCNQMDKAVAAMKEVLSALERPSEYGCDPVAHKALLREGEAYERLGTVFLEAKQAQLARRAFDDLNDLRPDEATLALHVAQCEFVAGKPEQALEEVDKYFESADADPTMHGAAPFDLLANTLQALGKLDQLLPRLESLHAAQPKNRPLALYLAEQYRQANRLKEAQILLESSRPEEHDDLWVQPLAAAYRQARDGEKLLHLLGQLLQKTESLSALETEAQAIANDEPAIEALLAAAEKLPATADSDDCACKLRAAGLIAAEAKRWSDVKTLFNRAIELQPRSAGDVVLVWGIGLSLDDKLAEAEEVFQRGIDEKRFPDDKPILCVYLAGVLDLEGKPDAALAAAKIAVEKQSKNAQYRIRIPAILYHAKRYDEAAKAYREFLDEFQSDFHDDHVRETVREARLALANLCLREHQQDQAVEWLEQVLDEFPDDAGANNDLGYLWADHNEHLQRALRMIQSAVAAEPENQAYRDSLGWALFRLGRFDEALVELKKASAGSNVDGEVLDHLAETYSKLGKTDQAVAVWKRAAQAFQKAGELEKMKKVEKKFATRNSKIE